MEGIERFSFWRFLNSKEQALLLEHVHRAHYRPGQLVTSADSECSGVLMVQNGLLRVYLSSSDGREATVYRLRQGETCVLSASCMLSAVSFDVQICAEQESDLLLLPAPAFSLVMQQNLLVENCVYKAAAERFSDIVQAIERMLFLNLEQRVASFLLDELDRLGSSELRLTQEQLARAIGSAREAVSRTLKQFTAENILVCFRGGIRIIDPEKLRGRLHSRSRPSK